VLNKGVKIELKYSRYSTSVKERHGNLTFLSAIMRERGGGGLIEIIERERERERSTRRARRGRNILTRNEAMKFKEV